MNYRSKTVEQFGKHDEAQNENCSYLGCLSKPTHSVKLMTDGDVDNEYLVCTTHAQQEQIYVPGIE